MIVTLEKALAQLEKHCPLCKPVIIVEISKTISYGRIYSTETNFIIEIAVDVDSVTQVDTLIHKWAQGRSDSCGDDSWGIEYARCYRAVYFISNRR